MFDVVGVVGELNGLLDELLAAEWPAVDSGSAVMLVRETEAAARRLAAVQVRLLETIDASGAFVADGHGSAKAMVRHVGRLSGRQATGRARAARMFRDLPQVAAVFAAGVLGTAQCEVLGRVHANVRVRAAMPDAQDWFLRRAARLSFADFEAEVRQWERLVDVDGPEPANSRNHDNRNVTLLQGFDLSWRLDGSFAALQGASIDDIFGHYIDAERLADWEKARAEHGDTATAGDLARTEPQRRADALWQVFQDAAGSAAGTVPVAYVHNIVWSNSTIEEALRRLSGDTPRPYDPHRYRCETLDGVKLEPVEAAANALIAQHRRVVLDAASVVIDLGRARAFTGGARLAAQLNHGHCAWPGCHVATTRCEIDHSHDHAKGGDTNPANGGPFCGRHNRWKQNGFTVWRDPTGQFHIYRPNGTEIE